MTWTIDEDRPSDSQHADVALGALSIAQVRLLGLTSDLVVGSIAARQND